MSDKPIQPTSRRGVLAILFNHILVRAREEPELIRRLMRRQGVNESQALAIWLTESALAAMGLDGDEETPSIPPEVFDHTKGVNGE